MIITDGFQAITPIRAAFVPVMCAEGSSRTTVGFAAIARAILSQVAGASLPLPSALPAEGVIGAAGAGGAAVEDVGGPFASARWTTSKGRELQRLARPFSGVDGDA